MTILNIYKEDDLYNSNVLFSLNDGFHYIGRKNPSMGDDKRISRKHARIVVHKNGALIQSVHINPTFFKSSVDGPIQILRENQSLVLNNNDCFALLENSQWFKVKIDYVNNSETTEDVTNEILYSAICNKRLNDEDILESTNKRIKTEVNDSSDTDEDCTSSDSNLLNTTVRSEQPDLIDMPYPLVEIKLEPTTEVSNNTINITRESNVLENNQGIKTERGDNIQPDSEQPSSSTNSNIPDWKRSHPNWKRDRCWYGINCYRKNPLHKDDFSHPGDNDYDNDPDDNRPICPFGSSCYRLNIQHRREYRHFGKPAPKPNINVNINVNRCPCEMCNKFK